MSVSREEHRTRLHPGRLATVVTEGLVALADGFAKAVLACLRDERVAL
ncbi:MAG: hypothetical protein QOJ20_4576, partial [Mycobacterium sp.]|nr:hypothetical protein [Mycobacterium sp.]